MNHLLILGAVLLVLGIAAYPPGLLPFYEAAPDTLQVSVPKRLVERGYPATIMVSRDYFARQFKNDYALLVNRTFTADGIYDYSLGRIVTPDEARTRILGHSSSVEVNYVKIAFMLGAVVLFAAGASYTPASGGSRYEPAGGYVP